MAGTVRDNALSGQVVANYRVGPLLGRGGMGAVYEVTHQYLGRRAALKVLHSQFAHTPDLAARFVNEARAANLVQHPSVVSIFEIGLLPDGNPYILMEYLNGQTLSQRIRELGAVVPAGPTGRSGVEQKAAVARILFSVQLVRQLASALHALHDCGVIHRDLKPDNVVVVKDLEAPGGERAKLLDFGIAKIVGGCDRAGESPFPGVPAYAKTALGALLGTPVYMGPEQWRGKGNVDHRADMYSLGCILYELLTGRPPYCASAIAQLMQMHVWQKPPSVLFTQPEVPRELAELVQKMLAKEPAERPTTGQVDRELELILDLVQHPAAVRPVSEQAATIVMRPEAMPREDDTIPVVRLAAREQPGAIVPQRPAVLPGRGFPLLASQAGPARLPLGDSTHRKPVGSEGEVVPIQLLERTASGSAQLVPLPRVRWGVSSTWLTIGFMLLVLTSVGLLMLTGDRKQPAQQPSPGTPKKPKDAPPKTTDDPKMYPYQELLQLPGCGDLRSDPSGAEVHAANNRQVIGKTPYKYREFSPSGLEIILTQPGYQDRHVTLDGNYCGPFKVKLKPDRKRSGRKP